MLSRLPVVLVLGVVVFIVGLMIANVMRPPTPSSGGIDMGGHIKYVTATTYNPDGYLEGSLALDAPPLETGDLLVFHTPLTGIPESNSDARLRIEGEDFNRPVKAYPNNRPVPWADLRREYLYTSVVGSNQILLLEQEPSDAIPRKIKRAVTIAELQAMFNTPIELVPAPGTDKFLLIHDVHITTRGAHQLREVVSGFYLGASDSDSVPPALTDTTNAVVQYLGPFSGATNLTLPPYTGDKYLYVGVTTDQPDLTSITPPFPGFTHLDLNDFQTVDLTYIETDGREWKFLRSNNAIPDPGRVYMGTLGGCCYTSWVLRDGRYGIMYVLNAIRPIPYYSGASHLLSTQPGGLLNPFNTPLKLSRVIAGQALQENTALSFGFATTGPDSRISIDQYDELLRGIRELEVDVTVRYTIISR